MMPLNDLVMSNEMRQEILSNMPENLVYFLKQRKAMTKFMNNLHLCCKNDVRKRYPTAVKEEWGEKMRERIISVFHSTHIIRSAFDWERTPEGFDYWYTLSTAYNIFINLCNEDKRWEKE